MTTKEELDRRFGQIGGGRAFALSVEGALERSHVTVRTREVTKVSRYKSLSNAKEESG